MGKQKQLVISRFFSPQPKPSTSSAAPQPQIPPTTPPKITTTVSFSPEKRLRNTLLTSPNNKRPKLSETTNLPLPNPNIHQKFLDKLLEPSSDLLEPSRPSCSAQISKSKCTPLEQQVVELKAKYPDVLLMVEVGYKYRFFGKDAENAAMVLGIYAHMDHNFLTASIPTVRLHFHVRRLVSAGYKVGVVKQTETAAIKAHGENKLGPFSRELSALYTKATLEAAEDLGGVEEKCGSCSNYLFCVVEKPEVNMESGVDVRIGAVAVEVSTGDVVYGEFDDNLMRAGLEAMVLNLSPVELLLGEPLSRHTKKFLLAYAGPASNVRVEHASEDCFRNGGALAEVMSLYENLSKSYLPNGKIMVAETQSSNCLAVEGIMVMPELAIQALALTIQHLKQFGLERIICLGASFQPFSSSMEMTLSSNALQQLEVLRSSSDSSEGGSLLQCMNHTVTIFGSRLFRHWVTHPLCDRNMIHARLDAVSEILESMGASKASESSSFSEGKSGSHMQPELHHIISSVLITLAKAPDVQRGITRIFHGTATASEFISIVQAILVAGKQLQQLPIEVDDENSFLVVRTVRSVMLRKLILTATSSSIISIATGLLSALNKEAADQRDLLNLFVTDHENFPEVAAARTKVNFAHEKLDQLIRQYRKQLQMSNLEFMSVSGVTHLIELPLDVTVPSSWVKVNSTKKTIRYHPPEVINALDQLTLANEELSVVCRDTWGWFLKTFGGYYSEFQAAVQALATLDCLYSLAMLSRAKQNYVRPVLIGDDEPVQIHISSGRHPVMENILQDYFVPNDTNLHANGEYCQIVTGPNMGGKSCYIRQVALISLMAQVGSYVPASSAKLCVLDGIYTRMGASDSIQLGRSTFLEELSEASHILQHCASRSLVIIDELGRGTSTHDGVAIAYATLHYLLEHKRCMTLFVTHYPEIVDIRNEFLGSVEAYHVSYLTQQKKMDLDLDLDHMDTAKHVDVTYLYKLVPGKSERSFGFKVAQLAQLPSSCIKRAISVAARLESEVSTKVENKLLIKPAREAQSNDNPEDVEYPCAPLNCSQIAGIENLEEVENAYMDLFNNLNVAFLEEGVSKKLHCLNHAKSLANKLLNR